MQRSQRERVLLHWVSLLILVVCLGCMSSLWVDSYGRHIGIALQSGPLVFELETFRGRVQITSGTGTIAGDKKWVVYSEPFTSNLPRNPGYRLRSIIFWTRWWLPTTIFGCAAGWVLLRMYPGANMPITLGVRKRRDS